MANISRARIQERIDRVVALLTAAGGELTFQQIADALSMNELAARRWLTEVRRDCPWIIVRPGVVALKSK